MGTAVEPKDLAQRMGLSPKRLRSILRKDYPRATETKGKRWAIPQDLASKVAKDYQAKKQAKEATKQAEVKKDLEGGTAKVEQPKQPAKGTPQSKGQGK